MSMISKQVEELRKLAKKWRDTNVEVYNKLTGAADTIETLSAKVRANNLHGGWIPVSERLPDKNGEYIVDKEQYFVPDHVDEVNHYRKVTIGHYNVICGWCAKVYAWMPLPEPYRESTPSPRSRTYTPWARPRPLFR